MLERIRQINSVENDNSLKKVRHFSISSILEQLKKEVDFNEVAKKVKDKHFNDPNSKYYQKSVEEIRAMWNNKADISKSNGKALDDFIGLILNEASSEEIDLWKVDNLYDNALLESKCSQVSELLEKFKKAGFKFLGREEKLKLVIEDEENIYIIHGRFDALFEHNGILHLIDWKNSENIDWENKWENLLGPCAQDPNANGILYAIQLLFYKYCLVHTYKVDKAISPSVVQFSSSNFKIHPIGPLEDNFTEEKILDILKFGAKKIMIKDKIKERTK